MHLKSLTLRGFKSFADRAILKFEPGVTVIVGPNGSGKSNINDAILWVLGEQSPRSLRGASMEDVVFAGSNSRDPLSLAEVSLSLDNSDGYLPIEYSDVTITRRTVKEGENAYFLNGSPCRLLDIYEILSDSGVGREMYSVISQGRLEEILNSKPEDRRMLVEEAAGVYKYKRRKERSLRKIAIMENNLLRVKDVAKEVQKRLRPLETQAKKAETYKDAKQELKDLEVGSLARNIKELKEEWTDISEREGKLDSKGKTLKEEHSLCEQKIQVFQDRWEKSERLSREYQDRISRLKEAKSRIREGLSLLSEKEANIKMRLAEIKKKESNFDGNIKRWRNEIANCNKLKEKEEEELKNVYNMLKSTGSDAETAKKGRKEKEAELEKIQNELEEKEELINVLKQEISTSKAEEAGASSQFDLAVARQRELDLKIDEVEKKIKAGEEEKKELEQNIDEERNRLKTLSDKALHLRKAINSLKQSRQKIQNQLIGLEEKQKVLNHLQSSHSDYPTGAAWLLNKESISNVLKTVASLIKVRKKYEKAIQAVLGENLFCLVTKDFKDAQKAVDLVKVEKAGKVSFVVQKRLKDKEKKPSQEISNATSALSVVKFPKDYGDIKIFLLEDTYIVDDINAALTLSKKNPQFTFVTLDGEAIFPDGKIGISGTDEESFSLLTRKEKLVQLELEQKKLARSREKLSKQEVRIRSELDELSRAKDQLEGSIKGKEHEMIQLETRLEGRVSERIKNRGERESIEEKSYKLGEELGKTQQKIDQSQRKISDLERGREESRANLGRVRKEKEAWARKESVAVEQVSKSQVEIAALRERRIHTQKREGMAREEISKLEKEFKQDKKTVVILKGSEKRAKILNDHYGKLRDAISEYLAEVEKAGGYGGNFEEEQKEYHKAQSDALKLTEEIGRIDKEFHSVQLDKAQVEVKVNSATKRIVDEYNISLETALKEINISLSPEDASSRIEKLRQKVQKIGPVNSLAIGEFDQLNSRYEFLCSQIEDIMESKKVLKRISKEIDKKILCKFMSTFEQVSLNFQSVFGNLFPNGQAKLVLADPENPLESGIDISAQPSGKKLGKLSLLSGGEKALVALAFLFAIYHTRPSPFYILDEVEPSLDDVNLKRLISLLRELKKEAQFVIITHQRRTIELADSIYGVSMQQDGVSKLISQKIDKQELAS